MSVYPQGPGHWNQSNGLNELKKLSNHHGQHVWAIGGGKGGVGKSLVTANISICLALMGHKVVSVDLDLGGANLHTCLGVPIPELTLSDYLTKKVKSFKDLLTKTDIPNLQIISGAQDELGVANLKSMHKSKILSQLHTLDAQYILFDLGAGTQFNTLDFFLSSEQGLLVVLPEPTSIENTYRFIKAIFHRKLQHSQELIELRPLIDKAMNAKLTTPNSTPLDLIKKVIEINPDKGKKLQKEIAQFCPKLIMNQVRTQNDIDLGFSIQNICKRYFGIDLEYVGYLEYDASVWKSVKKRKPLLTEFPHSKLVPNFDRIVQRLTF